MILPPLLGSTQWILKIPGMVDAFSRPKLVLLSLISSFGTKETLVDNEQASATSAKDLASSTKGAFLVATALHTKRFTVPPTPSTTPLP